MKFQRRTELASIEPLVGSFFIADVNTYIAMTQHLLIFLKQDLKVQNR